MKRTIAIIVFLMTFSTLTQVSLAENGQQNDNNNYPMQIPPMTGQEAISFKQFIIYWLNVNPKVAFAMKWCNEPGFYMPDEEAKIHWFEWTDTMRDEFLDVFAELYDFGLKRDDYLEGQSWMSALYGREAANLLDPGFPDPPTNHAEKIGDDDFIAYNAFTPDDTWQIYIYYVALSLVAELQHWYDWSILDYDTLQLNLLFDSSYWFRRGNVSGNYSNYRGELATDHGDLLRENNLAQVTPPPPRWTYWYLDREDIVAGSREETIVNLVDWTRDMVHAFGGKFDFAIHENYYDYRGSAPVIAIFRGTVCSDPPAYYVDPSIIETWQHWTTGCHTTAGFYQVVLRILNIPVEIVRVCGHSAVRFITEDLYLDHADTPYYRNQYDWGEHIPSFVDAREFLIDRDTFYEWFGGFPENENRWEAGCFLGRKAQELIAMYGSE